MKSWTYSFALLFATLQLNGASDQLKVEKNKFGDSIIIVGDNTPEKTLLYKIKAHNESSKSYFVDIPYTNGALTTLLIEKHGLSFYSGDNEKTRLVKRLDVDIPDFLTGNSGAKVVITRKIDGVLQALFTIEKDKKYAVWPGGMSNKSERVFDTAIRELKEELGLKLSPEHLTFFGILETTRAGGVPTNHTYVFHAPYNGQDITPDGKEVLKFVWASIKQVLKEGSVSGMPIREHKKSVLQALQDGDEGVSCLPMSTQQAKINHEDFYFVGSKK